MDLSYLNLLEHSIHTLILVGLILTGLLHLLMAAGVARDMGLQQSRLGGPLFMPPFGWVLAVLISGLWALGVYWLMHHSSLSRDRAPSL